MSAYLYEISGWAGTPKGGRVWVETELMRRIPRGRNIRVDLYLPADSLYGDPTPAFMVLIGFPDRATAESVIANGDFVALLEGASIPLQLKGDFMDVRACPINGAVAEDLLGEFSFVVRYFLPAENVQVFQDYYQRVHPAILAEFDGIRNIFCNIPEPLAGAPRIPSSNYLIGNQVLFDDTPAFEAANETEVGARAMADVATFPKFSDHSVHYAMQRTRLLDR